MATKKGCLGLIMSIFGGSGQAARTTDQLPYQSRASLLTPAEISFYHVLASVVGERAVICPKVGLKDVVFIPGRHDRNYFSHFGRISQKHVDFVLCSPKSMEPILAVELDDQSHNRQDRIERDSFVDEIFEAAGLPLLHFAAATAYNTSAISTAIESHLTRGEDVQNRIPQVVATNQSTSPLCPRHGIPMILRTAAKGPNAGQQFYGCPNYPNCREIIRLD